jgi:predicted methyltransferase
MSVRTRRFASPLTLAVLTTLAASGCPSPATVWKPPATLPASIMAAVDAPDRDPADKKEDVHRRPGLFLAFAGVQPGMKVADLVAFEGYTTELLARAVGPNGQVLSQNPKAVRTSPPGEAWTKRLAKPANAAVKRQETELDAPFAPGTQLDVITLVLNYHDLYWVGTDRARLNAAVLAALKPGGAYVIVDAAAAKGAGSSGAQRLHRVEEATVIKEVAAAGFKLAETGDFMRNPDDKHDAPSGAGGPDARAKVDRFILKFVKP